MAVPRRAFALILVLIAVGATFALALQGAAAMRTATAEAVALRRARTAERGAIGAASILLTVLTAGAERRADPTPAGAAQPTTPTAPEPPADDLPDMPAEMRDFLRGLARQQPDPSGEAEEFVGGGLTTRVTGGPYTTLRRRGLPAGETVVRVADLPYRVRVIDVGGLVNINRASRDGLARFFQAEGLSHPDAATLADQIADWRDEDSVPREFGAERDDYRLSRVSIRNGPFRSLEELLYLPAMTRARFDALRDRLTVIGDGRVTATTAPRSALLSVDGMTPDAADAIISARDAGTLRSVDDLDDLLDRFARDAPVGLRLDPTAWLRLIVTPVGAGPAVAVDAVVSDDGGVTILGVAPADG